MRQLFIIVFIGISFNTNAQDADSAWIRKNYTKKEVYIPMRDGIRLFTSIYIPKNTTESHPILMTRTPYSCRLMEKKILTNLLE